MGVYKKLLIERMDNYKLREAEDFEDGVDVPVQPIEDKTWSVKHEGHLNRNNIIFNEKMRRLVRDLEEVNNSLAIYTLKKENRNE